MYQLMEDYAHICCFQLFMKKEQKLKEDHKYSLRSDPKLACRKVCERNFSSIMKKRMSSIPD